jgi:hypothetical protein
MDGTSRTVVAREKNNCRSFRLALLAQNDNVLKESVVVFGAVLRG